MPCLAGKFFVAVEDGMAEGQTYRTLSVSRDQWRGGKIHANEQ